MKGSASDCTVNFIWSQWKKDRICVTWDVLEDPVTFEPHSEVIQGRFAEAEE